MVAAKDQDVFRIFQTPQISINRIGCSAIVLAR
jgi:hypothetical protein